MAVTKNDHHQKWWRRMKAESDPMKSKCTFRKHEVSRERGRVLLRYDRSHVLSPSKWKNEGEGVIWRKWGNLGRWIKTVWMYGGGWHVVGLSDLKLCCSSLYAFTILFIFLFILYTHTYIDFIYFNIFIYVIILLWKNVQIHLHVLNEMQIYTLRLFFSKLVHQLKK